MSNNTTILDETEVRAWLALKANTENLPVLSEPEVSILLRDHSIGSVWVAEHSYKFDDTVVPTLDNRAGRKFRCVSAGTSATDEPCWSDFVRNVRAIIGGIDLGVDGVGSMVLSDGDVGWVDDGVETDLWDLEELASAAWLAKAAKASELVRLNRGGNDYDWEAIYRHCVDMAGRFGGAFIK